jgi:hypothetical protein
MPHLGAKARPDARLVIAGPDGPLTWNSADRAWLEWKGTGADARTEHAPAAIVRPCIEFV